MKIEVIRSLKLINKGEYRYRWYFKIVASNGAVLAHSEQYNSRTAVEKAIMIVQRDCGHSYHRKENIT